MQVSYHCNLNFLGSLLLSDRSENNHNIVQKNTGWNRAVCLWLYMLNIQKRYIYFSVRETYLNIAYFSC